MIYEKLRENRQRRDMTIPEMAKLLNLSAMTISNYERGQRVPSIDKLYRIMIAYDLTTDDIIEWLKELSK